ncbi:MAG: hypothetical protein OHK0057_06660 [Thermoflexibacter sp.]
MDCRFIKIENSTQSSKQKIDLQKYTPFEKNSSNLEKKAKNCNDLNSFLKFEIKYFCLLII